MSDNPITRPLGQSEIRNVANDDPYRILVLTSLEEIKAEQQIAARWRGEHSLNDALEFLALRNEITNIKANAKTVESGVNDYEENVQQFVGMRRLIVGIVAVIGTIGAAVLGILEIAKAWGKP